MIRDSRIPRNAVLIYASLSSRAGLGAIFPSQATIAEECGVSERTVRTMLAKLEEIGVVERRSRRGSEGRGNRRTDAYVLHPNGRYEEPANLAGRSELPANGDRATGNQAQTTPLIEVDKEEVDRALTSAGSEITDSFDVFYLAYPRKAGKEGARRAFAKAARSTDPGVIIAGARRFAADPNLPEKQYVPHPATWLNQGRWDDEPLPPRAGNYQQPDSDEFGQDEWKYRS
jgi:DNA-binding Lrp family transcriptional regulator